MARVTSFTGKRSSDDSEFVQLTTKDKSTIQAIFSGRQRITPSLVVPNQALGTEISQYFEDDSFPESVTVGKRPMDINTTVSIRQARKLFLALAQSIFAGYTLNYNALAPEERCKRRKPAQQVLVYFFSDDGCVHQMIQMHMMNYTKKDVVEMEKELREKFPWPPKPQEREGGLKDNLMPRKIDLFNAKEKAVNQGYKGVAEALFPLEATIGTYLASFAVLAKALAQVMTDAYSRLSEEVRSGFYPPTYPTVRYFLATPGIKIGGDILPESIDLLGYGLAYQGAVHALIAGLNA